MKRSSVSLSGFRLRPAAFGRLCVETDYVNVRITRRQPAAFGRLCVETVKIDNGCFVSFPAAFGRLCVETDVPNFIGSVAEPSRLRAAVC